MLTDCDPWTREYYEKQGMPQDMGQPSEADAFLVSQMRTDGPLGIPRTHERLYREVQLGGGHVNEDMQQFMEWDRKVCRFYAVFDDLLLPQFERRPFVILYFLADDTIEIREQYPLNCGRAPFPIFFRRRKIPRGPVEVNGPMRNAKKKSENVQVTDLSVGNLHELLGYKFFIYDADLFTRKYFSEALGISLQSSADVRLPERAVPRPTTPQYSGFGSWGDSMASVLDLIPKAPRKDMEKLHREDGKILRFTAQLVDPKPEDAERLFVVNYYLADDNLSIHEPPQRNLGIVTGKFLEKGLHINQLTGSLFHPQDLYPGRIIRVYNRDFELMDMDEYTRKYIDTGDVARNFDLTAVLVKLRESLRQQFPAVRDIFRKFDAGHDGVLTMDEFNNALKKFNFHLKDHELMMLMKYFDTRGDGQISYNEFCDALLDEDYTDRMLKLKPPLQEEYDPNYARKAKSKLDERAETEKVRAAVRAIGDVIYKHTQTFYKLFKEFAHMTHHDTVTCQQILDALLQIGHNFHINDVKRTVLYLMPNANLNQINYIDFLKAMVTSYHDVAATR